METLERIPVVPLMQSDDPADDPADDPETAFKIAQALIHGALTVLEVVLRMVKFFPAGLAGGPRILKAFGTVFGDVRFIPMGKVRPNNLHEFLETPAVLACGGTWLIPKNSIPAGDFTAITTFAKEAVSIAPSIR